MYYKKYTGKKIILNDSEIILTKYIACGGNSVVFECNYKGNKNIIKFFKGEKRKRYERFKLEVDKIKQINKEIEEYTPKIIDSFFPKFRDFSSFKVQSSPFYIMEQGEKYDFENLTFKQKLYDILAMCERVKQLHEIDIKHRDIKPDNIIIYQGKLTFIDFGTCSVPNIKTFYDEEPMGSRGTIAPEMVDNTHKLEGYKYEYADIYSLGKTIWIILNNDKRADKFTTYESSNINSKLNLDSVPEGVIMLIEYIINKATQENYFKRITLEKVIDLLRFIILEMMNNQEKCNDVKFECLMERMYISKYDKIVIATQEKILKFVQENICEIGIRLDLKEEGKELCDSIYNSRFEIKYSNDEYFNFEANKIKFIFKIKEIKIVKEQIIISADKNNSLLEENEAKNFSQLSSFEKKTILTNPLHQKGETICLDCDICLKVKSNILRTNENKEGKQKKAKFNKL